MPNRKSTPIAKSPADTVDAPAVADLTSALLDWYRREARNLPWRGTSDPYAIWVSEIMLQQTQVQTVIPYWTRWMERFPTIPSLAKAPEPAVLKAWEGLGYYSRARNLRRAAQIVSEDYGGSLPNDPSRLERLPGIGRYTLGAIRSIAFNEPAPLVDGNVTRVLSRFFGIEAPVKESHTTHRLWSLAEAIVARAQDIQPPGERNCASVNQALMELGATRCRPSNPDCPSCPLTFHCQARRRGLVQQVPNLEKRPASEKVFRHAFVVEHGHRWLIQQRPNGSVNEGLWEFPSIDVTESATPPTRSYQRLFGRERKRFAAVATIKHSITRYRIEMTAFLLQARGLRPPLPRVSEDPANTAPNPTTRWVTIRQLQALSFPSAHRQIIDHIQRLRRHRHPKRLKSATATPKRAIRSGRRRLQQTQRA